jgi:hypothetical protein
MLKSGNPSKGREASRIPDWASPNGTRVRILIRRSPHPGLGGRAGLGAMGEAGRDPSLRELLPMCFRLLRTTGNPNY